MDELYDYFKSKYRDMEKHVVKYVIFNYYEMYIKLDRGVELIYDANCETFYSLETRHKLALIFKKALNEEHLSKWWLREKFKLSRSTILKYASAENDIGPRALKSIQQTLGCTIDEYYEKYVQGGE